MADSTLSVVTDYLRAVSARTDALADAELLAEYASGSAEAFAVLIRRHGPMVLGVCRRTLGPAPDADDAFQATFLSLARSAKRVTDTVPGWLFRVATRTARKALRRTTPTASLDEPPAASCADDLEWRDVRRLIDEELNQLPDRWRAPLVLCYLDGLTRAAAAQRLGWSLRTLHRRLDEGRDRLRTRLERRGLAPALLATAVFATAEVRAVVPPLLAKETFARGTGEATVPAAVRTLIFHPATKGGLAMKLSLPLIVLVGGFVLAIGGRQPAAADPRPRDPLPTSLVFAPIPKPKAAADPVEEQARAIRKKAVEYLVKEQKETEKGVWSWEPIVVAEAMRGGPTALALLALLENGVAATSEPVARGLAYLRTLKPTGTYVVSLQTQVFCRANQKEDADLIKKNVAWLEKAAARGNKGELVGWSYTADPVRRGDNSNTRYAVAALFAAHDAGFKVESNTLWADVQKLFLATQKPSGGWGYINETPTETHTMTLSGLVCLTAADRALNKKDDASATARKAAELWVADHFKIDQTHTYYNIDLIGNYGRLAEVRSFGTGDTKREWFREGVDWLEKKQQEDGHFKNDVGDLTPIVSTSFALRFLASRVEGDEPPPKGPAPAGKAKPSDELLDKKVPEATKKAIEFLKAKQANRGGGVWNWEDGTLSLLQEGGVSALAVLALLENGVKVDDLVVVRGLPYLRSLEPKYTYVVSLQTEALCKANQKADAVRIQRNVDWLAKAATRKGAKILGWGYQAADAGAPDNSNTRFAISSLYTAHKAGFKVKEKGYWEEVRDLYLAGQTAAGGWNYRCGDLAGKGTHTMTLAGLSSLRQAKDVIGSPDVATDKAVATGETWLADNFQFQNAPHTFYNFNSIAAYGRQSERKVIGEGKKQRDWYREGCEWLIDNQKPGGLFKTNDNLDQFEVVSTAFALRFLGSRPD